MDFTPKHDWTKAAPLVEAGRRLDPPKDWAVLEAETGIPRKTLYSKYGPKTRKGRALLSDAQAATAGLKPKAFQDPAQDLGQSPTHGLNTQPQNGDGAPSPLDLARVNARKLLADAVGGLADPSAQQIAAARLLLKDELEPPDSAGSPFAGIPTDELGLRALTLAVSVLGLVKVAAILREESKRQTLDLGLDWTPQGEDASGKDEGPTVEAAGPPAQDVDLDASTGPALPLGPPALGQGQA